MSFGFSKFGACAAASALLCTGLVGPGVQAQGQQKPKRFIELSETNSAEILTNLNRIAARKEGVDQLEDQLRSYQSLRPNDFEGSFNAPYNATRAVPRKALKELLDRQKNWGLSPEEFEGVSGASDADLLSVYGEVDKLGGKSSSLRQFYEGLSRPAAAGQNLNRLNDTAGPNDLNNRDDTQQEDDFSGDAKLPAGLRDKAQKLREMVYEDPNSIFSRSKPKTSFENFFGLNQNDSNSESESKLGPKSTMESFVDEFRKVLDGSSPAGKVDPALSALVPSIDPERSTNPFLDALTSPSHKSDLFTQSAPPGTVESVVPSTTIPDVNAALLNRWNPLYTTPKLELPKVTPPAPPNFDFPRRHF